MFKENTALSLMNRMHPCFRIHVSIFSDHTVECYYYTNVVSHRRFKWNQKQTEESQQIVDLTNSAVIAQMNTEFKLDPFATYFQIPP